MGYELEFKLRLRGLPGTRCEGIECTVEVEELCDDGGEPGGAKLFINKEGGSLSGTKFRQEATSEKLIDEVVERCREVLAQVRDDA